MEGRAAVASGRPPVDGRNPRPCSPPPATVGLAPVEESAPHRRHSSNRAEGSSRARSSLSARSSGATCKPRSIALARVSSRPGHRGCVMPSPSSSLSSHLSLICIKQRHRPAAQDSLCFLCTFFPHERNTTGSQLFIHAKQTEHIQSSFLEISDFPPKYSF